MQYLLLDHWLSLRALILSFLLDQKSEKLWESLSKNLFTKPSLLSIAFYLIVVGPSLHWKILESKKKKKKVETYASRHTRTTDMLPAKA